MESAPGLHFCRRQRGSVFIHSNFPGGFGCMHWAVDCAVADHGHPMSSYGLKNSNTRVLGTTLVVYHRWQLPW